MASRKIFFSSKPSYIYPTVELDGGNLKNPSSDHNHSLFEFDEADVWNSNESALVDTKKPLPISRTSSKKLLRKMEASDHHHRSRSHQMASASLPVNIPDWSKILKEEYREHGKSDEDVDDHDVAAGDDDHDGRVPPHEYLARRRGASFSVHEGIGRTLKGRDLRRVRNAIWKKTGFED